MELREWLFRNRKTVTDFAKEIGVSRSHLNMISNGKNLPSVQLAKKIEEGTEGKVTIMELLFPERFE
ncbi:MAG: helix-turn-helix transcriptional regulator [Pseudomonadota bacterium]